jgi:hypothetical protein
MRRVSRESLKIGDEVEIIDYSTFIPIEYVGIVVKLKDNKIFIKSKNRTYTVDSDDIVITSYVGCGLEFYKRGIRGSMIIKTGEEVSILDFKSNPPVKKTGKITLMDTDYIMVNVDGKSVSFSIYTLTDQSETMVISSFASVKEGIKTNILIWTQLQLITCLLVVGKLWISFFQDFSWGMVFVPFWLPVVAYVAYWAYYLVLAYILLKLHSK